MDRYKDDDGYNQDVFDSSQPTNATFAYRHAIIIIIMSMLEASMEHTL